MTPNLLLTRQEPMPDKVLKEFQEQGMEVCWIPLIQTLPLPYAFPKQPFDWIFFTSANTVKFFDFSKLSGEEKILAIGEKTAKALQNKGLAADFIPKHSYSEELLREWLREVPSPQKICLPHSSKARHIIKETLEELGHEVAELVIYQTVFPESSREMLSDFIQHNYLDFVIFASPSAWQNFYSVLKGVTHLPEDFWQKNHIITLGPVTSRTVRDSGQGVWLESEVQDMDVLYQEILQRRRRT